MAAKRTPPTSRTASDPKAYSASPPEWQVTRQGTPTCRHERFVRYALGVQCLACGRTLTTEPNALHWPEPPPLPDRLRL